MFCSSSFFWILLTLATVSSSPPDQHRLCKEDEPLIFNYDFNKPIKLQDFISLSDDLFNSNNCIIKINATSSSSSSQTDQNNDINNSFLIKFKLNKDKCENRENDTTYSYLEILQDSTTDSIPLLNKTRICEEFKNEQNFLLIKTKESNFQMKFTNTNNNNNNDQNKGILNSIVITPYKLISDEGKCANKDDFQCSIPSNICIESRFKCDKIGSCADDSDELYCDDNDSLISNNTNVTDDTLILQNATIITPDDPHAKTGSKGKTLFIGMILILTVATCVLIGVWVYGRRKRKWREFLAQLDNNTEWEYEQLEDGPLTMINNSNARITSNLNNTNINSGSNSALDLNFLSRRYQNANTNPHDPNDDTAQDIVFDRTSNKKMNIN